MFDNFSVIEDVGDVRVNIILWDTAGQVLPRRLAAPTPRTHARARRRARSQEDYVGVRKIWSARRAAALRQRVTPRGSYDNADVYFLCFSLVHPNSFHNIKSKVRRRARPTDRPTD